MSSFCNVTNTGVNPGGGGGGGGWGMYPPHFFGWSGWPVQIYPPLFEDKL